VCSQLSMERARTQPRRFPAQVEELIREWKPLPLGPDPDEHAEMATFTPPIVAPAAAGRECTGPPGDASTLLCLDAQRMARFSPAALVVDQRGRD
jgi:hypothetical protein